LAVFFTIIIFTSDNGGERFADTWPFTGKKTELFGRGFADSGLDLMACTHPEGPDNRPGLHQHGLDADVARGRWDRTPSVIPRRWHESLADPDSECASGPSQAVLALQGECPSERRAMAITKFLKILDNTFLFNVVEDPLERANLKDRQKDVLSAARPEWYE